MTMRRLAMSLDRARDHYDVVVVGSGYGGAIMAARLALAGRRVCVLERGRELRPGDFPATFWDAVREVQLQTDSRRWGRQIGLFDLRARRDVNTLVGCGLGGTSLINAGTLGSTEILLRSRAAGLRVSPRLGHAFSGNGNAVAFAYDTDQPVRAHGLGRRLPTPETVVGPCITGVLHAADGGDPRGIARSWSRRASFPRPCPPRSQPSWPWRRRPAGRAAPSHASIVHSGRAGCSTRGACCSTC
jgi:putative NAD(P)-binding protein